jgi:hypothetical protein
MHTFMVEGIASSPTQIHCLHWQHPQKYDIYKSLPKLMPPLQLTAGNPKFHVLKWKPQIACQNGNPKFPCEVETPNFHNTYDYPQHCATIHTALRPTRCNQSFFHQWKDVSSLTLSAMHKLPLSFCNNRTLPCCYCNPIRT